MVESWACGNGTRCVADFISKETKNRTVVLKTTSGVLVSKILGNNIVKPKLVKLEQNGMKYLY